MKIALPKKNAMSSKKLAANVTAPSDVNLQKITCHSHSDGNHKSWEGGDIDIMTSCSEKNAEVAMVLISSIAQSHIGKKVNFWFFHLNVPPRILSEIGAFCASLESIRFFSVKVDESDDLLALKAIGGKPDCERFLWFVAHQYLPDAIKRVLYLDALDTLVMRDISEFYNKDFAGRYVLACREINQYSSRASISVGPLREEYSKDEDVELVRRASYGLFNSGSIVLNLERFRDDGVDIEYYLSVLVWAKSVVDTKIGDQGLFSLAHGSEFLLCDDTFNYRFFSYSAENAIADPAILHFCGFSLKPFNLVFSPKEERRFKRELDRRSLKELRIRNYFRMRTHDFPYYRAWWNACSRTPVYSMVNRKAQRYTRDQIWRGALFKRSNRLNWLIAKLKKLF